MGDEQEVIRSYTPEEAAELLHCHPYTVQELLRGGKLKGYKLHSHWRITDQALKEFMSTSGAKIEEVPVTDAT